MPLMFPSGSCGNMNLLHENSCVVMVSRVEVYSPLEKQVDNFYKGLAGLAVEHVCKANIHGSRNKL